MPNGGHMVPVDDLGTYRKSEVAQLQASHDALLAACRTLAFELNSTPESGAFCWCNPDSEDPGHSPGCEAIRAAMADVKELK